MAKRKRVNMSSVKPSGMVLRPYAMGHALSTLAVIWIVFYGVFVWFGGYNSSFVVARYPIAFSFLDWTFLFGLAQTYAIAYVFGWIFAKLYNSY
jgi:hypothetical protein